MYVFGSSTIFYLFPWGADNKQSASAPSSEPKAQSQLKSPSPRSSVPGEDHQRTEAASETTVAPDSDTCDSHMQLKKDKIGQAQDIGGYFDVDEGYAGEIDTGGGAVFLSTVNYHQQRENTGYEM